MSRPNCRNPDACPAAKPTSHCRPCSAAALMRNPEVRKKHQAAIAAKFADPVKRAAHNEVARRNIAPWQSAPGTIDYLRQRADEIRPLAWTPEAVAKNIAARPRAAAKRTQTMLSWCPPDKIEQYRFLTRSKHLLAEEARAIIEAEVARESPEAEARRTIARITHEMHAKQAREKAQAY